MGAAARHPAAWPLAGARPFAAPLCKPGQRGSVTQPIDDRHQKRSACGVVRCPCVLQHLDFRYCHGLRSLHIRYRCSFDHASSLDHNEPPRILLVGRARPCFCAAPAVSAGHHWPDRPGSPSVLSRFTTSISTDRPDVCVYSPPDQRQSGSVPLRDGHVEA